MARPDFDFLRVRRSKISMTPEEHFWSRVDKSAGPSECWPWTGHVHKTIGYGCLSVPNSQGQWRTEFAHRMALFWTTGEWSVRYKTCVRHLCDNPPCCNPAHLRLGSLKENTADARRAGTLGPKCPVRGERHIHARVTALDVPKIRQRMDMGESAASVAKDYGMAGNSARSIWKRTTWKHVP